MLQARTTDGRRPAPSYPKRVAILSGLAADSKNGAVVSLYGLFEDRRLNHTVAVTEGVLQAACSEILSGFFREKRLISPP